MDLGECLIGQEEEDLVLEVLRSKSPFRYYSATRTPENPPSMAAILEKKASTLLERPHVLGVTSGTAALEMALGALFDEDDIDSIADAVTKAVEAIRQASEKSC